MECRGLGPNQDVLASIPPLRDLNHEVGLVRHFLEELFRQKMPCLLNFIGSVVEKC